MKIPALAYTSANELLTSYYQESVIGNARNHVIYDSLWVAFSCWNHKLAAYIENKAVKTCLLRKSLKLTSNAVCAYYWYELSAAQDTTAAAEVHTIAPCSILAT